VYLRSQRGLAVSEDAETPRVERGSPNVIEIYVNYYVRMLCQMFCHSFIHKMVCQVTSGIEQRPSI
jgi:hypothetical protein